MQKPSSAVAISSYRVVGELSAAALSAGTGETAEPPWLTWLGGPYHLLFLGAADTLLLLLLLPSRCVSHPKQPFFLNRRMGCPHHLVGQEEDYEDDFEEYEPPASDLSGVREIMESDLDGMHPAERLLFMLRKVNEIRDATHAQARTGRAYFGARSHIHAVRCGGIGRADMHAGAVSSRGQLAKRQGADGSTERRSRGADPDAIRVARPRSTGFQIFARTSKFGSSW